MRYLSIDLGGKRTGLAVGDDLTKQAGPVDVIHAADPRKLLEGIQKAIRDFEPDALVIGIAYNMDGSLGPAAKKAVALATLLRQATGLEVHQVDERLTTFDADESLKQSGYTHDQKKNRRDALAAAAILRDFLANRN